MVCIIDDREDVWNFAPNLVHVKPYIFFKNVGDINAPEKQLHSSDQQTTTIVNKAKEDPDKMPRLSSREIGKSKAKEETTEDPSTSILPPVSSTEQSIQAHERRDSIDMPTIEGAELQLQRLAKVKAAEMDGTASVVSDDLELSDDNSNKSGSNSSSSSSSHNSRSIGKISEETASGKKNPSIKEEIKTWHRALKVYLINTSNILSSPHPSSTKL